MMFIHRRVFKKHIYFLELFYVTAKMSVMYGYFPYTSDLPQAQPLSLSASPPGGTFVAMNEPTLTHHCHLKS